jgi:hypothetical protein
MTRLLACALALLAGGCAHYGFSPGVKTHMATVAVPVLVNETLEYGAEQDLTDAIITELTNDNTLRVVGEAEAHSIIRGSVVLYARPVMSYDAAGNPREYKVRVVAHLSYEDLTRNETIWEDDVEGWAVYTASGEGGEPTTEEDARALAFEKLAQDVLSKTVQGW